MFRKFFGNNDLMNTRQDLLKLISKKILSLKKERPILVGIDGGDGSGKTHFAKELAELLAETNHQVLCSSIDNFHNPREIRKPKNKESYISFFEDSFNYNKLKEKLLDPLKHNKKTRVYLKYFNHILDLETDDEPVEYSQNTILIFDGIFLHRDDVQDYWGFSIFLDVNFETTYRRMAKRDGCPINYKDKKNERYYKGQLIYFDRCNPKKRASVVVDNNVFKSPKILSL
jgi:uridine kinase